MTFMEWQIQWEKNNNKKTKTLLSVTKVQIALGLVVAFVTL